MPPSDDADTLAAPEREVAGDETIDDEGIDEPAGMEEELKDEAEDAAP